MFFGPFVVSFSESATAPQIFFCLMAADATDEFFSRLDSSFYVTKKSLGASEENSVENRRVGCCVYCC